MSRCYPCPPPKIQRSGGGAHREPWCVEPLKIQTVQSEPRRVKREKKEKSKVRKSVEGNSSLGNKRCKSGKSLFFVGKEEEQERSDLTEEHDEPVSSHGYCYHVGSSHGTSNRDKDESTSSVSGQRRNIIRIRLPSQKLKPSDEAQLCSTSGREDVPQLKEKFTIQLTRQSSTSLGHKNSISILEPVSCPAKASGSVDSKSKGSVVFKDAVPTVESLYKSLIEDWVPPILQTEQGVHDDEDWLFGSRVQTKKIKLVENDASYIGSSDLLPRAKYLPEADIYALPFTLPF